MQTDSSELTWREEKVLIIGRASPEPSKKYIETVCTGAVTEQGQILRLYPIPLRYLGPQNKYKLWTWAKLDIKKNESDKRKESYKVREDSIQILKQITNRAEQFSLLKKAMFADKESLIALYHADWTSVGVVEIEYIDFYPKIRTKSWVTVKPYLRQELLFESRKPLEQLPFEMHLKFKCRNNPACRGHDCSVIGWQYVQAFRKFAINYGSPEAGFDRVKQKIEANFGNKSMNAYALLAKHSRYDAWMLAELYFFEKSLPDQLF
jgi:hypothetical protein